MVARNNFSARISPFAVDHAGNPPHKLHRSGRLAFVLGGRVRWGALSDVGPLGDGLYGKAQPTAKMLKAIRTPDVFDALVDPIFYVLSHGDLSYRFNLGKWYQF